MKSVSVTIGDKHVEVGQISGPVSGAPFATYYDRNTDSGIDFGHEASLTHQSFAGECDINEIVRKGLATGNWPLPSAEPVYADVADVVDYREALDIVKSAQAMFAALPAEVRREFENDPASFVAFAEKPENADKLVEWGLATRVAAPPTETAPAPSPASKKGKEPAPAEGGGEKS